MAASTEMGVLGSVEQSKIEALMELAGDSESIGALLESSEALLSLAENADALLALIETTEETTG